MKCYKPGSGDFTASGFSSPQSLHRDHHDQQVQVQRTDAQKHFKDLQHTCEKLRDKVDMALRTIKKRPAEQNHGPVGT